MTELLRELEAVALLPCPFCGGEAALTRGKDLQYGDFIREQWVACCKGELDADCFGEREPSYFAADLAIAAWNTRTHHAEIAAALKDKTRLDWLEARFSAPSAEFPNRVPGTWQELEPTGRWLFTPRGTRSAYLGGSMREVVDKAMADYPIDAHNSAREVGE